MGLFHSEWGYKQALVHDFSPFHSWSPASPYALALGLTAFLCVILLLRGWRHRAQSGGLQMMLMTAAAGLWALLYCFELASPALSGKVLWAKAEYVGIALVPIAWLLFARAYSGAGKRLDRRVLALVALVPLATVFLVATNDFHGWVWKSVSLNSSGVFPTLALGRGPWFWVNIVYSYGLLIAGDVLLLRNAFNRESPYRRGILLIIVASLAPWIGNGLSLFWSLPAGSLDVTPFGFALTAVVLLLAISRVRLFSLFPALLRVARTQVLEKMADAVIVLDLEGWVVTSNPAARRLFGEQRSDLAGLSIGQILGDRIPCLTESRVEGDLQYEITLGRGSSERYFDVVSSPLGLGLGYGMGRLLVLRDITERRRAEEAAKVAGESLRARVVELNALWRIAETVARPGDLREALMTAAEQVAEALDARAAAVVTSEDDGEARLVVSTNEAGESETDELASQDGHGCFLGLAALAEGCVPVVINDLTPGSAPEAMLDHAGEMGCAHLLAVPLVLQAKTIGALTVVRAAGAPSFKEREVEFVQAAAGTVAAAIVHARLREEEHQKTASMVREHLARELHDAVTQSVYSASLMAQALPTLLERDQAQGLAGLMQLQRLVRSALAELRILLYELRPATLVGVGLDQLLERLGDSISGQADVNVTLDTRLEHELPVEVKTALYRIAQEAFNNIAKHARAERVWATAVSDADGITLDIEDDGVGVDIEAIVGDHMGLGIMRERAEEIGAEFSVHRVEPTGTQVLVRWPRPQSATNQRRVSMADEPQPKMAPGIRVITADERPADRPAAASAVSRSTARVR